MPIIYHVTTASEWKAAQETGFYETASLKAEGFIHCSEQHQVAGVLERYFSGREHLIKLVIDPTKLTSRYVQEWSPSTHDTFPHIYGPINLEAVIDVVAI
jgi:uncharacterized protein (DUF952 family)